MYSEKDLISFGNFVMSDEFAYRAASVDGFGPASLDQIGSEDIGLMSMNFNFYFDEGDGEYTTKDMVRFANSMRSDERAVRIAAMVDDDDSDILPEERATAFGIHLRQVIDADVQNFRAIYKIVNA